MTIEELVDFSIKNPQSKKQMIDIGKVTNALSISIHQQTQIDTKDFLISVDNFGILHTIKKHGSETELKRGQLPIEKSDFYLLSKIIFQSDSIESSAELFQGKNVLIFQKKLNGVLYFVRMECRKVISNTKNKHSRMVLLTMFKRKKPMN